MVGGEDVEAVVADVGGGAGDRVERPLDLGPDAWLGLASAWACPGWLGGAGEVEEVGAFGVVELERSGQCLQHALGGAAHVSAFKAGVVLDAHAGQDGDLFAAQPRDATSAVGRQPGLLGRDPAAAGGQELSDLGLGLHDGQRRPGDTRLGDPASSSLHRGSHLLQIRALLDAMTTENKTWLITGAGRGMGVDIAKAALAAGHNVVATGRNPDAVEEAVGDSEDLLAVRLDVTSAQDAEAAVRAASDRFGGIDVLVNNAASFYAGFFEELTPEQMDRQITTTLVGPMNVTRAVLPVMRRQRSGHVVTISSSAGFAGFAYGTAYAASKFGVDGWMESLAPEIEPFGIHTTVVNPGFFRTELLTKESTNYAEATIEDYAESNTAQRAFWESQNGRQSGDPAKLAHALVTITDQEQPPFRFIAGADALAQAEEKLAERRQQIDAYRDLSSSLALDEATA